MDCAGKVVVVTGGASGIGLALCQAFAAAGARGVVVADLGRRRCRGGGRDAWAGWAWPAPPTCHRPTRCNALVAKASAQFGQVDVFCSNAGVISRVDEDAPTAEWQRHWDVNVMAHVHAANAVLPQMLARGEGYLVQTASAAGLLSQVNAAPYTVTKHAARGLCRMAVDRPRRRRHPRELPVPAGRGHADAAGRGRRRQPTELSGATAR